ncbi:MAG TPA: zinc metalloprotease HtpX [Solirubrobacterales bacterium]
MTTTKRSTFGAGLRTTILLATLSGLLVAIGYFIGGPGAALGFLFFAALLNMGSYFFSDKIALTMSRAKPISESEAPRLYQIVRELCTRAGLPMPRIYMIPVDQPNAFATGRNPKHAAVAVTRGIMQLLSEDELRGVLGHELTHVKNYDILITSVAATIIQLSISRQREFAADAGGAELTGNPESLASALLRLEEGAKAAPMQVNQAAEPLYIVKPFSGGGFANLFSTHPPIEERVRRLRQMRPALA